MIKIIEKQVQDVAVCTIEGKLAGLDGKGKIQEKVHDLIENKVVKVILDLAKVNWIDSTGLGELIASLSSAKNKDADLVLANLQDPVQSLLKMTNLDEIFEIYDNVELALEKLKK